MSDKYRQLSAQKNNCKQGHWTGTPTGGSGSGCWLCVYGCAVLAYLYWKGKEPNKDNVTSLRDSNANVVWSKMGISEHSTISTPCIGKFKSKSHYVYISSVDEKTGICTLFDPGKRSNTSMNKSEFVSFYY